MTWTVWTLDYILMWLQWCGSYWVLSSRLPTLQIFGEPHVVGCKSCCSFHGLKEIISAARKHQSCMYRSNYNHCCSSLRILLAYRTLDYLILFVNMFEIHHLQPSTKYCMSKKNIRKHPFLRCPC